MRKYVEFSTVVFLSIIWSTFILRNTLFSPGYIAVRDTIPDLDNQLYFYSIMSISPAGTPTHIGLVNVQSIISGVLVFLGYLMYGNILCVQLFEKLQLLLFPFVAGYISMYYSLKHFKNKYLLINSRYVSESIVIFVATNLVAALYVIAPTSMYWSFWLPYGAYYGLMPAFIMLLDKYYINLKILNINKRQLIREGAIFSLFLSFLINDIRTLIYSVIILVIFSVISIIVYRKYKYVLFLNLITLAFYLLINIRLVLDPIFLGNIQTYTQIASYISAGQWWVSTTPYSIFQTYSDTSLFFQTISYNKYQFMSFFIFMLTFIALLFYKNKKIIIFPFIYIVSIALVSTGLFPVAQTLIYYLGQTKLFSIIWIFYPYYISIFYPSIQFILLGLTIIIVINQLTYKRIKPFISLLLILMSVVTPYLIYSQPSYISGNYDGVYMPVNPPIPLLKANQFLQNRTEGLTIVLGPTYPFWSTKYSGNYLYYSMPNTIVLVQPLEEPDQYLITKLMQLNVKDPGYILAQLGVEYILFHFDSNQSYINNNYSLYMNYLIKSNNFRIVFNDSYITILKNLEFNPSIRGSYYLGFNYPYSLYELGNMNNLSGIIYIPDFVFMSSSLNVSADVDGFISSENGSSIIPDIMGLLGKGYQINLFNYVKRLYFPYNWTVQVGYNDIPLPGIYTANPSSFSIPVSRTGNFTILIYAISSPEFRNLNVTVSNISYSLSLNTPQTETEWYMLNHVDIGSEREIHISSNGPGYIITIEIIPYNVSESLQEHISKLLSRFNLVNEDRSLNIYVYQKSDQNNSERGLGIYSPSNFLRSNNTIINWYSEFILFPQNSSKSSYHFITVNNTNYFNLINIINFIILLVILFFLYKYRSLKR